MPQQYPKMTMHMNAGDLPSTRFVRYVFKIANGHEKPNAKSIANSSISADIRDLPVLREMCAHLAVRLAGKQKIRERILDMLLDDTPQRACAERRIELYFSAQNDSRIILCKNTVAATVLADNPSLETTKRDKSSHGFGHRIVETIAKSYGGFVDYYEEDGMFCAQILLPMKHTRA